jgi:branched-chain amino acid transport system ATP-binding protein
VLTIEHITVRFGGLCAVNDVGFTIEERSITAVIGPNGAGKSTLFNVITGVVRPVTGVVRLEGRVISGRPSHELARLGIGRTFQTPEVCREMTVLENVLVGGHAHIKGGLAAQLVSLPWTAQSERRVHTWAREELQRMKLWALRDRLASSLPLGKVRLLELARALVTQPRLLLLDEPASGLNSQEATELARLIQEIRERGITILLIEHNVKFVMDLADQIAVLDDGQLISFGSPGVVRTDRAVIDAYLGRQRS